MGPLILIQAIPSETSASDAREVAKLQKVGGKWNKESKLQNTMWNIG